MAVAAIGAVIAIGSAVYSGIQQKKAADAQAEIEEEQIAANRAEAAFAEAQAVRDFDTLLGEQKLNFAASGRELEGSPMIILEQTVADRNEEVKYIRQNASRRTSLIQSSARETRKAGSRAMTSSLIGAAGTAVSAYGNSRTAQPTGVGSGSTTRGF